jgi:hypothetical protein
MKYILIVLLNINLIAFDILVDVYITDMKEIYQDETYTEFQLDYCHD